MRKWDMLVLKSLLFTIFRTHDLYKGSIRASTRPGIIGARYQNTLQNVMGINANIQGLYRRQNTSTQSLRSLNCLTFCPSVKVREFSAHSRRCPQSPQDGRPKLTCRIRFCVMYEKLMLAVTSTCARTAFL